MNKNLAIAGTCIILIAIITFLSALPIGWTVEQEAAESVKLSAVSPEHAGEQQRTPLYTISVTSTFMPRQYELPRTNACLYNTQTQAGRHLPVDWNVQEQRSEFGLRRNTLDAFKDAKTATLNTMAGPRAPPLEQEADRKPEVYDQLLIFFGEEGRYPSKDCFNLQPADFEEAIIIPVAQN